MKATKYDDLDNAICEYIRSGHHEHPTLSFALLNLAHSLLTNRIPHPEAWRLITRRMQAMRRAGRLRYERNSGRRGKWSVVDDQRDDE